MLRRKLTSFTIMYTAGIAAGFFMLESLRTAEAIGFMIALSIAVLFAGGDINRMRRAKLIMIAVMICGFLSFAVRYTLYEYEASKYEGVEARIRCKVVSASENDERISLIVRCGRRYGGPRLMQLALYDYDTHPATDMTGDIVYDEAYELTGIMPTSMETSLRAALAIARKSKAKNVVIKQGARGAFLYDGKRYNTFPAVRADKTVDTTSAGDAFTCAMTLEYLRNGGDIKEAIKYGNVAGAITVTRPGATSSIPTEDEINAFLFGSGN